jgi:hypothetical protein
MCTTSSHPPFGERSKILHSVRASNLASNCSERLWLPARTILVALENYFGWLGELSWLARGVELKQLRTCRTCLTYASSIYASSFSLWPMPPPKRKYNAVSTERSMKFGNIVWVETSRYSDVHDQLPPPLLAKAPKF